MSAIFEERTKIEMGTIVEIYIWDFSKEHLTILSNDLELTLVVSNYHYYS